MGGRGEGTSSIYPYKKRERGERKYQANSIPLSYISLYAGAPPLLLPITNLLDISHSYPHPQTPGKLKCFLKKLKMDI